MSSLVPWLASIALVAPQAAAPIDFARDVQPILEARCFRCHSGEKAKSGLRLDARKRAMRGGNSGEKAIVPGHPERSRLIQLVKGEKAGEVMPPKGERLDAAEIATLERWIEQGATWPDELSGDELVKEHWAFVKPVKPAPPSLESSPHASWPRNELDSFTLAKMEEHGLAPSPEADRATLIRRLSLDLIGLPPSPAEIDAFVGDAAPDAYERLARRLLASPRYGERWARMWLDLARFADSTGYGQDSLRPFLWRWRDWVIDAFNANERFDQFTIEQLAGDLLPEPTLDQLLATAFHRNTMTNVEGGTIDEEFRVAAVKDRIDSTMSIWMGLTFGCAKCHSHKFDPIPQKDYYRFFAFFNQTEDSDRADEEPRLPTPTREQAQRRELLLGKIAALAERRDARALNLAEGQARWEREVAASDARWRTLSPSSARSVAGAELSIGLDRSVRASGPDPADNRYEIEATTELPEITAIRLEALADPALPRNGPGRSAENGNFVLTDFRLVVTPKPSAPSNAPPAPPKVARWIRIEQPGPQKILSLAEVQWLAGGENLAPRGKATQSSVDFDGRPELAIDGNTDGRYLETKSTTHNRIQDDPWWELDLGANQPIERLVLWNRTDGGLQFRLAGIRVSVLAERRSGEVAHADASDQADERGRAGRELVWQTRVLDAPEPSVELDPSGPFVVGFARATADFEQEQFGVAEAIDGDRSAQSGWAIGPQQGRSHQAVFETDRPVPVPTSGALLRFELRQGYGTQHTLGRLRLSACGGEDPPRALPAAIAGALVTAPAARDDEEKKAIADHYRGIAPELAPFNAAIAPLEAELTQLDAEIVRTPILRELPTEKRRTTHLLVKSNWLAPADVVEPATPAAFPPLPADAPSNRLGVALWLVSQENPLTARVTVNRFWAQLFGRGLVETEEDFGTQGTPPSHPELLDWLAVRFLESGWDVKELLFTIVTSATYRQRARVDAIAFEKDPRDVWLSRHPRRRLEAEMVRDQALAIAGLLSPKLHGPSVFPPQPDDLWQVAFNGDRNYPTSSGEDRWRRSLYTFWRRTVPPPSMQTFDAPSREYCTIRRQASNTPLQAFVTLNDPVFVEAAQALGRRAMNEGGATPRERIAFLWKLATGEDAGEPQVAILQALFARELAKYRADPESARALAERPLGPLPPELDASEAAAWTVLGNVVLNLDEVLTSD